MTAALRKSPRRGKKRSFDRRKRNRFSEAGVSEGRDTPGGIARPGAAKKFCAIIRAGRCRPPSNPRAGRVF
jgi:hypothetical protein